MEEAVVAEAALHEEQRSRNVRNIEWAILATGLAVVTVSAYNVWTVLGGVMTTPIVHIGLTTLIISLAFVRRRPSWKRAAWIFTFQILAWTALAIIWRDQTEIARTIGFATTTQTVFLFLLMVVTFYYSWIMFGPVFAVTAGIFALYTYVGDYTWLPDLLRTAPVSFSTATSKLSFQAVGGTIINFSALFLFMLLMMGALLNSSGGAGFIWAVSRGITKRVTGGAGLVAVVSSSTVATFTGGGAANAGITGTVTIPMMKRTGYTPEKAAAIEAVASVAGSVTPPILGAAAFIMADFIGVTYIDIVVMTAIPAVLFYLGLAAYISFTAQRDRLAQSVDEFIPSTSRAQALIQAGQLVIPMTVLLMLLIQKFSISYSIFWTIVTILGIWGTLVVLARFGIVEPNEQWKTTRRNLVTSATLAAGIAMAAATLDVMISAITQTGLGLRLASSLAEWGQGSILLTLLIAVVFSYFLGLGLPALPVYVITAVLLAPALVRLGADLRVAHYVMFYTALVFPNINPPVASTVLVTSQMAGANYLKASIEATKYAGGAMYLPFMLFFAPELLLVDGFNLAFVHVFAIVAASIIVGQGGLAGYMGTRMNLLTRLAALAAPMLTFLFLWARQSPEEATSADLVNVFEIAAWAVMGYTIFIGFIGRYVGLSTREPQPQAAPVPAESETSSAT